MKKKRFKLDLMPLKVRIVEMGLNAKSFARKVHIDPTTIYAYFGGTSTPTVRMLLKLSNETGIAPGDFFKEDKGKKKKCVK